MSNKYDDKQRPDVGFKDMDKYEFGGLEIDNTLTNGYQLYIPYGIHCEIFGAIQDSIRLMQNKKQECKDNLQQLTKDMEKIEERYREICKYAVNLQQEDIKRIDKNLKILEKIMLLENGI